MSFAMILGLIQGLTKLTAVAKDAAAQFTDLKRADQAELDKALKALEAENEALHTRVQQKLRGG